MTTGLSPYVTEKVLNFYLRGTTWAQPATVYVGIDSALNTTEISAGGYSRQTLSPGSVVSRGIANTAPMTWTPSETWPQAVGWRAWDASTGGNALAWGPLSPKPTPTAGTPYTLGIGEWSFSLPSVSLAGEAYPVSDWFAGKILDKAFRNVTGSALNGSLYEHLAYTKPSMANSGGVFPTASGYAPKAATYAAWSSGRCYLASNLTFEASAAEAYSSPIIARCVYDGTDPVSAHLVFVGDLIAAITIAASNPVVLRAADTFVGLKQDTTI